MTSTSKSGPLTHGTHCGTLRQNNRCTAIRVIYFMEGATHRDRAAQPLLDRNPDLLHPHRLGAHRRLPSWRSACREAYCPCTPHRRSRYVGCFDRLEHHRCILCSTRRPWTICWPGNGTALVFIPCSSALTGVALARRKPTNPVERGTLIIDHRAKNLICVTRARSPWSDT